jgi:hypothetical protein
MRLGFSMTMRMAMVCSVCGNERGTPDPDAFEAMLVGAAAFKFCPCCGHSVSDFKDRNYRRRARRWIAKHRKEEQ